MIYKHHLHQGWAELDGFVLKPTSLATPTVTVSQTECFSAKIMGASHQEFNNFYLIFM